MQLAFGELNDPTTIVLILSVVILAVAVVIFGMSRRTRQPKKPVERNETEQALSGTPFKVSKSVQTGDASHAKDELRILELEREILSDAIRRLYEAHAEGKITEQERERLAGTYKARMGSVKDSIAKDETIVALHELEGMQEDLMKLFSERFGELSSKIKVQLPTQTPASEKKERDIEEEEEDETEEAEGETEKPKKRKKPETEKPSNKTEAEQRIEQIRGEVEKVLDKLGQMEIES
jgi:hypothetical protein